MALDAPKVPFGASDTGDAGLAGFRVGRYGGRANMEGMTTPVEAEQTLGEGTSAGDQPWQTIVWNDPVNLMSYVTYVFQKLFGYSRDHATKLMLDVHHKGRAIVTSGSKEKVEGDVAKLHAAGLWATMEQT
ncbi:ATP-dependent Clp protease adaptor protein ClpS [Prauserella halophila]|nr:ATP-dependent Clp protease adaptor protein ClpS [Prauserella halophila]